MECNDWRSQLQQCSWLFCFKKRSPQFLGGFFLGADSVVDHSLLVFKHQLNLGFNSVKLLSSSKITTVFQSTFTVGMPYCGNPLSGCGCRRNRTSKFQGYVNPMTLQLVCTSCCGLSRCHSQYLCAQFRNHANRLCITNILNHFEDS